MCFDGLSKQRSCGTIVKNRKGNARKPHRGDTFWAINQVDILLII
jgi:hypothetical protein